MAEIFPYILLLYFFDSFCYTKNSQLLFTSNWVNFYKILKPGINFTGLFPWGITFAGSFDLYYPTREGIYFPPSNHLTLPGSDFSNWEKYDFNALNNITTDQNKVYSGEKLILKTHSSQEAKFHSLFLKKLTDAPLEKKTEIIKVSIAQTVDLAKLNEIKEKLSTPYFWLASLSSYLGILLFFLLPSLLYIFPQYSYFIPTILLLIGIWYPVLLGLNFYFHRRVLPEDSESRIYYLFYYLLIPPGIIHSLDKIFRDLFVQFDHLTLAVALLPKDEYRVLFKNELFRIDRISNCSDKALLEYLEIKRKGYENLLEAAGLTADELLSPPIKIDDSATHYCPQCLVEYCAPAGKCSDCDTALMEYSDPA